MRPFWTPVVGERDETLRPLAAISALRAPVLILHGARDRQVPVHHGERLAAANPDARFLRLEEGDHYNLLALPAYRAAVLDFLAASPGRVAPAG